MDQVLVLGHYLVNKLIKAANETSEEIKIIEKKKKPTWLPPTFFLDIGVKTRLIYERLRSISDI